MKPFHSLAFLVSVFLVLSALAYIFPENGIKISNSISLKFYTLNDLFKKKNSADISSIIESAKKNEIFDTQKTQNIDTLLNDTSLTLHKQISIEVDTVLRQIEFPENNQKLLNSFFASLSNISQSNDLVRILHYGDSQIEADRITSYIRIRPQSQF